MQSLVLVLSLFAAVMSPVEVATFCVDHSESLGEGARTVRYIQLTGTDDDHNARQVVALNYLSNTFSRSRALVKFEPIEDMPIVAIDLAELADPIDFDKSLAELIAAWELVVAVDPYWHIPVIDADKTKTVVAGPWCQLQLSRLQVTTGSAGAILRVDHFIARAGADVTFNAFAGVPATQSDYLKLFGVDDADIAKRLGHTSANLPISAVTFKPRRIVSRSGPHGPYISTEDGENDNAAANPFHFPVTIKGKGVQVDAFEVFALKSNGMWGVAIFDGAGKRADTVPDKIAKNTQSRDGIIRNGADCFICHGLNGGTGAGLQPFQPDFQTRLNARGIIGDPTIVGVVASTYNPRVLQKSIERSLDDHHDACLEATGVEPKQAVTSLAEVYQSYRDGRIGISQAAYECGVAVEEFRTKVGKSTDPMIGLLMLDAEITRGSWESAIPEAMSRILEVAK